MNRARLLDTNVIVRALVNEPADQVEIVRSLLNAADRGDLALVVLPTVLAEVVFVLESFYEVPRAAIASALCGWLGGPGIELIDAEVQLDALHRYGDSKLHFVDCVIAATAQARGLRVATFDRDLAKAVTVDLDVP